jgi:two-component system NtrC family sensor kinase
VKPVAVAILIGLLVAILSLSGLAWVGTGGAAVRLGDLGWHPGLIGILLALLAGGVASAGSLLTSRLAARAQPGGTGRDAPTERTEASMEQLLQAEKMTALGELVAGVAHELNNPLAAVMGYTQLLLSQDLPAEVRRRLETVYSEADRASKIVRNLLTFARKHPPEKKYLGLNGIIEKTLELKAYHFRTGQIQVVKDLAPDLPMTMLDYFQLQQVLLNLFNNAEQALEEGGRGGTIRIATRQQGDRIEARVTDDGPGIPPEVQSRVFEPFFTTKKEGKGTGLGLPLCYGIVQEHGGVIRVESEPGRGTTFVLEFPILPEPGGSSEKMKATTKAMDLPPRVLVVDEEPSVQGLLVELLSSKGYRVDTASDIQVAERKISTGGCSVVLTDLMMPHGSGWDLYETVVGRMPQLAQRFVFMSGLGVTPEVEGRIRGTGNPIVLKPFKIEEIEGAIARALSK